MISGDLGSLLIAAANKKFSYNSTTQLESLVVATVTLNRLLEAIEIQTTPQMCAQLCSLLSCSGDYDLQLYMLELILRLCSGSNRGARDTMKSAISNACGDAKLGRSLPQWGTCSPGR